jgi:hypothetical protein
MEVEETAEAVFGGGKRMREDEFEAWRNTTNLNVERHPFYRVQDERRRRTDGLPKPMSSSTMATTANSTPIYDNTSTPSIWHSPVPAPTAVHLAASKGLGRVRGQYSLPSE